MVRVSTPVTIRPVKIRRVCWILAPLVVIFFAVIGAMLSGSFGTKGEVFQTSDQIAMGLLGVFGAAAILLLTRPKVIADTEHVVVRNVIGGYDLPWSVITAVRFDRGQPWATLELADGDVVALMAIQATDKDHAVTAIRSLRGLQPQVDSAEPAQPPTPPLIPRRGGRRP
jgi:hypothetical protein